MAVSLLRASVSVSTGALLSSVSAGSSSKLFRLPSSPLVETLAIVRNLSFGAIALLPFVRVPHVFSSPTDLVVAGILLRFYVKGMAERK